MKLSRLIGKFCNIPVFLFLFCILSGLSPRCSGQNSITVKQLVLPHPFDHAEVKHMMLDDEGFLWFLTNQGIWRFDGTDVQPVDIHNPALPQNSVPEDIYHYHNSLFFTILDISKSNYTVLCYNINKKTLKQFKMPGRPFNYLVDKTGELVFMTTNGVEWSFTEAYGLKQKERFYSYPGWVEGEGMENTTFDTNGDTYIFSHKKVGLANKKGITWTAVTQTDKKYTYVNRAYCTTKYIVAGYSNGIVVFNKKTLERVFEDNALNYQLSLPSKDGVLPVYRTVPDLLVKGVCREPGNGKFLVGTDKGIFEIAPSPAMPGETETQQLIVDFFKNKSVRSIYRTPTGKLYVGTYQGLFVCDGSLFKEINNLIAYTMQPVNRDTVLVGMEGGKGFFLLDTRTDKGYLNPVTGRTIGTTKIIKYNHGYLSGAYNFIYHLAGQANGTYKVEPWLQDANLGIVKDLKFIKDELWVASMSGIYGVNKAGQQKKIYPIGRSLGCYAMLEDTDGIWIGTGGEGLVKIDKNGRKVKELNFNDGLAGEYVYSLFRLNKLVITGTSGGISIFDEFAGMQPVSIPDPPPSDGLLYQEFNHSALFNDTSKHKIILGGTQGLTFLDEDYLKSFAGHANDRVRLSYIKRGYSTTQPSDVDIFASREDNIEILPGNTFTGLKFSGPFNQKYLLFRIKELDAKWHQGKLSDEVSLFALPPGNYTLEARFPSVTDARYWLHKSIIVVPRYYQTIVFKILMSLLAVFIIFMAWRYNAQKIRQEQQMRTSIASDLHDEIGSTLTRISINSELFAMKASTDSSVVEKISDDSKKALSSISDIIWSIDSRNDNNEDLVLRMKDHAHKMLEDIAEVNFSVAGITSAANIPQTLRQNIYLIYKEAINNIIKHNEEPTVWISLENSHSGFMMEIRNTVRRKKGNGYKGQGLKNMQMRAKRINANIQVTDNDDFFTVTLKMKEWK